MICIIRLLTCSSIILFVSALLMLTVDSRIYKDRGWFREKKYAAVMGWIYCILSVFILIGLMIYV
ncbi:CLC_0170 family protein [Paenibacillus sp. FSL R5-0912]|uniref:CLC_0170 family protein n=1 Tax=unclassified Paenibacillus TaxID=185978 RepID=UPI0004F5B68E|nr:hypothetical protein R50912_06860 [Paenibacillus sp. FSL R5-0912]